MFDSFQFPQFQFPRFQFPRFGGAAPVAPAPPAPQQPLIDTVKHTSIRLITGLIATGTNQVTAYSIPTAINLQAEFITVPPGTGMVLPVPKLPARVAVFNAGADVLSIYPPIGGTIDGGTVDLPYGLGIDTGIEFWASSLSNWYVATPAVSGSGAGTVQSVEVIAANGFAGTVASPTISPAITLTTTATGVLKGSGGTLATAVAGLDYVQSLDNSFGATQGDTLFRGSSAWTALPPGSNGQVLTSGGVNANPSWTTPSGGGGGGPGSVTSASVVSANGFGGTVANPTTTPAITINTSVTGLLKGNGTGVSAAVANVDYAAAGGPHVLTASQNGCTAIANLA